MMCLRHININNAIKVSYNYLKTYLVNYIYCRCFALSALLWCILGTTINVTIEQVKFYLLIEFIPHSFSKELVLPYTPFNNNNNIQLSRYARGANGSYASGLGVSQKWCKAVLHTPGG